ncbi:hypothetical protein FJT64_016899 [Amphibalanus amphitrite]|uniref:Transmembrane protein n=1 Tax=Amphibalanus amphitrite TaxID=1232801 RepID=A0A6A4X249_AMPAM|nr:hypothetical protein FJT64_016899 [Amphibalanus amphitrite]
MSRYGHHRRGWGGVRITGCGSWSGVGNWQKAVIILCGLLSMVIGGLLMFYGLKMWWQFSSDASEATQYLVQRLNRAETQLDLVRVNWEHEIFVLLAGAAAVVEFCISMVLFSAHHQLSSVGAHVSEVMRRPLPPLSDVYKLEVSESEQRAFRRAMGWLDEMGNLDERRILPHYFSWSDSWREWSDEIQGKTLQILIRNEWIAKPRPTEFWEMHDEVGGGGRKKDDGGFKPLCASGRSSLRRRGIVDAATSLVKGVNTLRGQLHTVTGEITADLSADENWRALAKKFDKVWNLQNISLAERAYEIGVNQQCLYTIKIRTLQDLKEVKDLVPTALRNAVLTLAMCALHVLAAVAAHLLVRALRRHFEELMEMQRDAADIGVTVTVAEKRDLNPFRERSPAVTPDPPSPHTPVYREPPPPYQLVAPSVSEHLVAPSAAEQSGGRWSPVFLTPAVAGGGTGPTEGHSRPSTPTTDFF